MPIDIIRAALGTNTHKAIHVVRPGSEVVIREGRNADGILVTVYTAMGVCGTEASGTIVATENAKDVTCVRCAKRAERALEAERLRREEPPEAAPVLSSPEVGREPRPPRRYKSPGRERHGRIRLARAERRRKMKGELRG